MVCPRSPPGRPAPAAVSFGVLVGIFVLVAAEVYRQHVTDADRDVPGGTEAQ
jgi:hypothetical protein